MDGAVPNPCLGPRPTAMIRISQTWMTFDYIDRLFSLPPHYLQTTLSITDNRYPRLTLSEYASDNYLTNAMFLAEVQSAIRVYFDNKAPATTSTSTPAP